MDLGVQRMAADLSQRRYRYRQAVGGFFAVALVILAVPSPQAFYIGAPLVVLGLSVRLWAAGHVHKNEELATTGPYALVRHPQYLGNNLLALGLCIASGVYLAIAVWALLFWLFYVPAIRREDEKLRRRFEDQWVPWAEHTPAVFPRPRLSLGGGAERNWSLRQAVFNGEPIWFAGMVVALALIYLRIPR